MADRSSHIESSGDIDSLERWKRSVERQVDWLKRDHDEWADELQQANPALNVPQEQNTSPAEGF